MEKKQKSPKEKKLPFKQSETLTIKRSQINFAPYNPKRHSEESIRLQKKNFKEVGFLGGIVWNVSTGNLVAGHKRIMAMDLIYGYDGTPEKDYMIKVEVVELESKAEMEQNIFMDAASTNTKQDLALVAQMLPMIDYKLAGLDQHEMALISLESPFAPKVAIAKAESVEKDFATLAAEQEGRKQEIKKVKDQLKKGLAMSQGATYITLSFDNYQNKSKFMEQFGYNPELIMIKGEQFWDQLNEEK